MSDAGPEFRAGDLVLQIQPGRYDVVSRVWVADAGTDEYIKLVRSFRNEADPRYQRLGGPEDGWVRWEGGSRPVAEDVMVEGWAGDGTRIRPIAAGKLGWGATIVAYRILTGTDG